MAKQIKELLSSIMPKGDSWKLFLLQEWPSIIGDLKVQIHLEKIQNDTLIVSVTNPSWMQELHCLSDVLIQKINEKLDKPYIKKLRFKAKARPKFSAQSRSTNVPSPYLEEIPLSHKQKSALSKIEDVDLQNALKKFYFRCHRTMH